VTNEEYKATQDLLIAAGRMVDFLDLDEFRARIAHAHAVGPILDPTLYRDGRAGMEAIDELAAAGIRLKAAFQRVKHRARAQAVAEREVDP